MQDHFGFEAWRRRNRHLDRASELYNICGKHRDAHVAEDVPLSIIKGNHGHIILKIIHDGRHTLSRSTFRSNAELMMMLVSWTVVS